MMQMRPRQTDQISHAGGAPAAGMGEVLVPDDSDPEAAVQKCHWDRDSGGSLVGHRNNDHPHRCGQIRSPSPSQCSPWPYSSKGLKVVQKSETSAFPPRVLDQSVFELHPARQSERRSPLSSGAANSGGSPGRQRRPSVSTSRAGDNRLFALRLRPSAPCSERRPAWVCVLTAL